MFICSVTLTKKHIALLLALALGVLLIAGNLLTGGETNTMQTNRKRVEFLTTRGLEADKQPYYAETIRLPDEFDSFWEEYEGLQKSQGLSLIAYRGKRLKKYTYSIRSYPGTDLPVYVNLFLSKGHLVACDITCPDFQNGWVKPLFSEGIPQQ